MQENKLKIDKNRRTKTILSLILNIAVAAMSLPALISFFFDDGMGNMEDTGIESLKYFTNLSNYLLSFAGLVMAAYCIMQLRKPEYKMPHWVFMFKYLATVSTTLTFLTCLIFLGPVFGLKSGGDVIDGLVEGYLFVFSGTVMYLHLLSPLCAIAGFIFFDECESFSKKEMRLGVIPEILYSILYVVEVLVIGEANGGWNDFYYFTLGGKVYIAPIAAVIMFSGTYLICKILWKFKLRRINHKE